jgi:hypothetical protein
MVSTWYVDEVGGNDSNSGLTFALRVSFRRPCHQISKVLVTNDTKSVRKWCGEEFFLTDFQKSLSPGSTSMCVEALLKPFLQKYRKGSEL